jgi:two-component system chemotaxis response regulator CheY
MKLLIVDDSKAMRMIVLRTLRQAGYANLDVTEASDGAEAFGAIQKSTPDLVLSDWNMPKMSGIELLDKIKSGGIAVKFGFVTSEGTAEMRDRAAEGGALFLIAKPFTVDAFREHLDPILK